ncbi:hypothetical protein [Streptomyces sp. NPDC047841]|uniref:hypothetical protein n=1 Tax=Streptomyces sp. NPDC047841 TaxID=3154708 RepID=UPI003452661A
MQRAEPPSTAPAGTRASPAGGTQPSARRFGRDPDRFGRWLCDVGDQVARTQQHAHPAGPTAIEILSVVADDLSPRPDGTAGMERERLLRLAVPYLGYLRPGHDVEDAREIALTFTLWAGPQLAALLYHDYQRINAYTSART